MVRLTFEYIKKVTCKSHDSKSSDDIVKKLTHLNLPERSIDSIDDLSDVKQLTVLYLQHNNLKTIENLNRNECLTHLYLQHNNIRKMENLNEIKHLRKLYMGHNHISVVEGLDAVNFLEELHIECQRLSPGETVYFDPRTVNNLSKCLRVLDISGNNICSVSDLQDLYSLERLDASNNALTDLSEVCAVVSEWPAVRVIDLRRNDITRQTGYRNRLIASTRRLETLDSKDINDITRSFIHRFEMIKEDRKDKLISKRSQFSDDIASIAKHLPPGLRQAVSASVQRDRDRDTVPAGATSLTLSLMSVPVTSPGTGLQPRPARKVSQAESVARARQRVERGRPAALNLPQLGHAIARAAGNQ